VGGRRKYCVARVRTEGWREMLLGKRIWYLDPVTGIQRLARSRNTEKWHKIGSYIRKFKSKWELELKKT
jgi:hypothetical protein